MTQRSRRGPVTCGLVAAAALMAACGVSPQPTENPPPRPQTHYCGYEDGDGYVIDEDACDDDGDGHGHHGSIIYVGGHSNYGRGTRIPRSQIQGSPIPWNNSAARQSAGLPPSGKVSSGQHTTSNAGVGKGSTSGNTGGNSTGG